MTDIKIKHEEMKRLYQAFVTEKTPDTRKHCPSPEQIVSLFSTNIKSHLKNEMIDHVSQCSHCIKELRIIGKAMREKEKFSTDIEAILHTKKERLIKPKIFNTATLRLSWVLIVSMLAITILLSILIIRLPQKDVYRGRESSHFELISPVNKIVPKQKIIFSWKTDVDAKYFILEIFDDSLYPVWKSEKIINHRFGIPNEILNLTINQKKYFWMVTAYLLNGKIIESQLQEFILSY
ncbi:MAG: hypothetical protein JXB23_14050 [Candidatus Aminicenantes bacterium]|nr:hypothetical protein [Candidatus Aminicenantes bacterium]